uniref:Uncharacterized protein n=1 Tax=Balaenoptera musculus TaxID=9771 RepID=A0A8C0C9N8_BALMU
GHPELTEIYFQMNYAKFITSYSLACHHWSCGGPEINSLLQRRVFQNCLAQQPGAQGQGRRQAQGACSELRHSQENLFYYP